MTAVEPFAERRNPVSGYYTGPGWFGFFVVFLYIYIISWQGFRHAIKIPFKHLSL